MGIHVSIKNKKQEGLVPAFYIVGDDLFSHPVARAVSSALKRFTAVFGMGTGVAPSLLPPKIGYRFESCLVLETLLERSSVVTRE